MMKTCEHHAKTYWEQSGFFYLKAALLISGMLAAYGPRNPLFAADFPPQDHGGADFIPSHGDRVWGLHSNIGLFRVNEGTTITLHAYDPATTGSGALEIRALQIVVNGEISARGKGFTGGGGGGAGGWGDLDCHGSCPVYPGGLGGGAPYGGSAFAGESGSSGSGSIPCGYHYTGCISMPGVSGNGGPGDGPFAGHRGEYAHYGDPLGGPGGYAAPESNGDLTTDTSIRMGSGGGGGGGLIGGPGGGDAFGAGGRGGGAMRLIADDSFLLGAKAVLDASGILGGDAVGDQGGDASIEGGGLPGGGAGAGGGILVDAWQASTLTLLSGARVRSLGGAGSSANGGTLKIFHQGASPSLSGVTIQTGRIAVFSTGYPPSRVEDWEMFQ